MLVWRELNSTGIELSRVRAAEVPGGCLVLVENSGQWPTAPTFVPDVKIANRELVRLDDHKFRTEEL